MNHKELVEIAYKWILKRGSCGIAFKELKTAAIEIPDVIGFGSGFSSVIECKVSRADFLKDKLKPHRQVGMGTFRYYLCPEGLITKDDLPAKWGLIYATTEQECRLIFDPKKAYCKPEVYDPGKDHYLQYYSNAFDKDVRAEGKLLYSALRRLFIKGYFPALYDKKYQLANMDDLIELNSTTSENI